MNTPPRKEQESGMYAPVWRKINQMIDYMREISVVNGRDVSVSRTMNGTLLLGTGGGKKKAEDPGTLSWRGEWKLYEDEIPVEPGQLPKFRTYAKADMVIRGGEIVSPDIDKKLILADGTLAGSWIATRDLSKGEKPGVPTQAEIDANEFDWELMARFASPTITARTKGTAAEGDRTIRLATDVNDAVIEMRKDGSAGSVAMSLNDTLGKGLRFRELRVCQNGAFRKMIVLASELYD